MKDKIIWTSNLAYAIGLITSDGHLQKDKRHIALTSKDKEQINNFAKALRLKNKITRIGSGRNKLKPYYRIRFSNVNFFQFLNRIGIYPNKSKSIEMVQIPSNLFRDFIRGLFDGDGTFYSYWDKRWKNSQVYQICFYSASFEFISWLKDEMTNNFKVKGFIRKSDGVWALRYVKGDTRKLYQVMYYDSDILYLRRKYIKIVNTIYLNAPVAQWFRADA